MSRTEDRSSGQSEKFKGTRFSGDSTRNSRAPSTSPGTFPNKCRALGKQERLVCTANVCTENYFPRKVRIRTWIVFFGMARFARFCIALASPLGGHDNPQRIAPVLVYAPTKRARVRRRHMPRASATAACTRHTFHRERGYGTLFLS
jgi:hypothetical protein